MKKGITLIMLIGLLITGNAQQESETAAVLNLYTNGLSVKPEIAGSLLRIELEKTGYYKVFDKHDIIETSKEKGVSIADCYGKKCLGTLGKSIGVNKIFSGSIEHLGKKIVISLKILDVSTGEYERTTVEEFVDLEGELQVMVQLTLQKLLDIDQSKEALETLVYFNEPPQTPQTNVTNNGPRVGIAYIGGELGERISDPESIGGFGAKPVVSQFGYQFEAEYLSAGDFHALVEGLVMLNGVEQQMFNPSFVFMNGFRSSKSGLEFAFGPSFGFTKTAESYFNTETEEWHLANEFVSTLDTNGNWTQNPYTVVNRIDSRGNTKLSAGFVVAVGKTFHSGYLNIPVNAYFSSSKNGWYAGVSIGFNIKSKEK